MQSYIINKPMSPIESPKITKANIKMKVATHRLSNAILKFLSQSFKSVEDRFNQNILKWKIWSFSEMSNWAVIRQIWVEVLG